jgi:hypothetical protein
MKTCQSIYLQHWFIVLPVNDKVCCEREWLDSVHWINYATEQFRLGWIVSNYLSNHKLVTVLEALLRRLNMTIATLHQGMGGRRYKSIYSAIISSSSLLTVPLETFECYPDYLLAFFFWWWWWWRVEVFEMNLQASVTDSRLWRPNG